ncbi:MAG: hypothetical protein FQY80_02780 [Ornithobacterium rhinotracheale]|nr:hypothetical protein [Ornithobacterium rhinotracheale]
MARASLFATIVVAFLAGIATFFSFFGRRFLVGVLLHSTTTHRFLAMMIRRNIPRLPPNFHWSKND